MVQVESDVIVPVEAASQKAEFAARTLRPRIQRQLAEHLVELEPTIIQHRADRLSLPPSLDLRDAESLARTLKLDRSVPPVTRFLQGGTAAAEALFRGFLANRLATYAEHRN